MNDILSESKLNNIADIPGSLLLLLTIEKIRSKYFSTLEGTRFFFDTTRRIIQLLPSRQGEGYLIPSPPPNAIPNSIHL